MALKAGYYGLKRSLFNKVKALPGIKSIGAGLSLNATTGELEATGSTISIEANPEGAATDNLIKLGLGEDVYAVPDASKTYQTDDATEPAIVDADYIPFFDSSAASGSGAPKKSTWSNFISKIKAKMTEFFTWEANSILGAKNRAYSQTNNSVIADIVSGLSYKVSWVGSAAVTLKKNDASGATIIEGSTSPLEFTADDNYRLYFGSSTDVTNIMVYDASDTDPTYQPYAMTNRELTNCAFIPRKSLYSSDDLNNCTEAGIYYIDNAHPNNLPDFLLDTGETVLRICLLVFTFNVGSQQFCYQMIYRGSNGKIAFRVKYMTTAYWELWKGVEMNLT